MKEVKLEDPLLFTEPLKLDRLHICRRGPPATVGRAETLEVANKAPSTRSSAANCLVLVSEPFNTEEVGTAAGLFRNMVDTAETEETPKVATDRGALVAATPPAGVAVTVTN